MKALLAVLAVVLASCADSERDVRPEAAAPAREPSVFDPVTIDPIQRARGVQDTIFEADAERRRQLEAQELGN